MSDHAGFESFPSVLPGPLLGGVEEELVIVASLMRHLSPACNGDDLRARVLHTHDGTVGVDDLDTVLWSPSFPLPNQRVSSLEDEAAILGERGADGLHGR